MSGHFSHQTNTGKTVNIVGDHTVVQIFSEPTILPHVVETDISRFISSLTKSYQTRYEHKLDGHFEITLDVSEDFDGHNSQTYVERYARSENMSAAFTAIHSAFLRTGRLLIVGNPGVGKTVLLLKLALNLLQTTDPVKHDPFPVMFNLASWSEKYEDFGEWIITMLSSSHGLSREFATTLLHQQRIIFMLDGLDELSRTAPDEVARERRAACLASLNEYLRRGRGAVVCCRREEFIQMHNQTGQDAPVSAKIEVRELSMPEVVAALQRAQEDHERRAAAKNLLNLGKTHEVLLDVLRTPFYFITALEVFDKELWTETDFPSEIEEVKRYLLNRFAQNKLKHSPNPNGFKPQQTFWWLRCLACLMENKGLVTFELIHLQPTDLMNPYSYIRLGNWLTSVAIVLVYSLIAFAFVGPLGLVCFLPLPIIYFFVRRGGVFDSYQVITKELFQIRVSNILQGRVWRDFKSGMPVYILGGGLVGGIWGLIGINYFLGGLGNGILLGMLTGLIWGLLDKSISVSSYPNIVSPYQRLKSLFWWKWLSKIFLIISFGFLYFYFGGGLETYPPAFLGFLIALIPAVIVGALFSDSLFKHAVLRLALYGEGWVPLNYVTFLDYAVNLRILEKDGGHWRFRHQNLQEHLSRLEN